MKPYQPSRRIPFVGLLMVILAALVGGALLGAAFFGLSTLFYLIFLFALVMGWLGGRLIAAAVHIGKVRNPAFAAVGGVLIALVMAAAWWGASYLQFKTNQVAVIRTSTPQLSTAEIDQKVDEVLTLATGQGGWMGFTLLRAQQGVRIWQLPGQPANRLPLGATLSAVLWLVQWLLMAAIAAVVARRPALQPFCEACGRWHGAAHLLGTLGAKRTQEALDLVKAEQFQKLGEELQINPSLPNVAVFLAQCGADCAEGDAFMVLRSQKRGSGAKPIQQDLLSGLISPLQTQDLLQGIENRKALYGL